MFLNCLFWFLWIYYLVLKVLPANGLLILLFLWELSCRHSVCVITDRDGPEVAEFGSGRVNNEDETGPAVCHDKVGSSFTHSDDFQLMLQMWWHYSFCFFVCVFWAVYKRTTRNTCWWQRMRSQSMPRTCWMSSTNHDSRWSGFNQVRGKAKSFCCCGNGECSSSEQVTKRRELLDGCQWRTDEKMNWWTADTADANNQLPLLPQTFVMFWSILCCFVLLLHYLHLYPEKHSSSPLHLLSKMSFSKKPNIHYFLIFKRIKKRFKEARLKDCRDILVNGRTWICQTDTLHICRM